MKLLLDLGNTRLKWGLFNSDSTRSAGGSAAWSRNVIDVLAQDWHALATPASAWAASVVDVPREAVIRAEVFAHWGLPLHFVLTPATFRGWRSAYAEPQRLGVDRFLAMLAARELHPGRRLIVVGAGTALTLDLVDAGGQHRGGLIAPGVRLMHQSVLGATARVQPEVEGVLKPLADNTADAVRSGCWLACAGLVERFVREHAGQDDDAPMVVVGGGDAPELQALLPFPSEHMVDAVLCGLQRWTQDAAAPAMHG